MFNIAKNQKSYTPEFKQQIVDLYNAGGTSYPQLEREFGVNRSTLSNWVKQLSPIKVSDEETVTFIQNNLINYSVAQLCSTLKFPRSTYYKALVSVPSNRKQEYEEFGQKVKQAYEDSKKRYGAVKICRILNNNGTPCSVRRVQRHMAEQGLRSGVVKKYNHHADHGSVPDDRVNILKRDFGTETINQKWCTDITYIHVQKEGWTYLASVMDLCSRKIIGYAYGTSMTAGLTVQAVENACLNSYSRKGNPYDNACIESFHSVLKKEEIYLHTYQDSNEARRAIFEYIVVDLLDAKNTNSKCACLIGKID